MDDQPDSRIKNIAERDRRQKHGDDEAECKRRLALKREAAGPHGAETVRALEVLRDYLTLADGKRSKLKGQIDKERKWLRKAKGRRAYMLREQASYWRNTTLSPSQRAESLRQVQKPIEELRHETEVARANIAAWRAEIKRIDHVSRDLLQAFLVCYPLRYEGKRVPRYDRVGTAIAGAGARRLLGTTPLCKLASLAKAAAKQPGGELLWPHTAAAERHLPKPG